MGFKNRIIGMEQRDPKTIQLNPLNTKIHTDNQSGMMRGTLDEVGWIQTVIINKTTGNLIDGHMRVQIAIENNEESIPVVMVELTEEEELKALSTFDPVSMFAKVEREKLTEILAKVSYQNNEVKEMMERIARKNRINYSAFEPVEKQDTPEKDAKEDKLERERIERSELVAKWGVEPGQIWVIPSGSIEGSHRVICGDSTDPEIVKQLVGKATSHLMVTDPPYGVSFESKFNPKSKDWDAIGNDDKRGDEMKEFVVKMLQTWMPYIKDDGAYYLWSAQMKEGFAVFEAIHEVGLHVQSQIVWGKNTFSLGQTDYHWQHEICWYAFKLGAKHRWNGGRDQSTLWNIKKLNNAEYIHPMQKPVELYAIPIKNHTKSGEVCFDPFLGCGSQIVAAEQYARLCYGCEKDPIWVAATLERMDHIGLRPELEK